MLAWAPPPERTHYFNALFFEQTEGTEPSLMAKPFILHLKILGVHPTPNTAQLAYELHIHRTEQLATFKNRAFHFKSTSTSRALSKAVYLWISGMNYRERLLPWSVPGLPFSWGGGNELGGTLMEQEGGWHLPPPCRQLCHHPPSRVLSRTGQAAHDSLLASRSILTLPEDH